MILPEDICCTASRNVHLRFLHAHTNCEDHHNRRIYNCLWCVLLPLLFRWRENFCPVLSNQTNWNKFKTLVYVRVNIFVFYGFPVSLVCSDAAFDYHNEIIELIAAYLHLYNNLSAFLSIAEDCTMARLS